MKRRWDEIIERLPKDRPIIGAELGVWQGKLSRELLDGLPQLTLYMVDRWKAMPPGHAYLDSGSQVATANQELYDKAYETVVRLTTFAGNRARIMKMDIDEFAKVPFDFDFVFIDADHTYEAVKKNIHDYLIRVADGGLLCGHDYDNKQSDKWGVKKAVDEFVELGGFELEIGDDHTWFVRLPE